MVVAGACICVTGTVVTGTVVTGTVVTGTEIELPSALNFSKNKLQFVEDEKL
jgi:translation elongation factor EF-Tu-like GTPase